MADEGNSVASSDPPPDETTLTLTLVSSSSSSITPGDSLHQQPLPSLTFDIVAEILSRLPVKSLLQLKSVCKSWKSLISDSNFAKNHFRVSTTRHHLVSDKTKPSLKYYPLSSVFTEITPTTTPVQLHFPLNDQSWDHFIGSCRGILCFSLGKAPPLVWNPSIQKFTKLPSLGYPEREGLCRLYGFGYDHVSDTYKVVVVDWYSDDGSHYGLDKNQTMLHTLGTNSWRRIQNFPYTPFGADGSGTVVCGTINWSTSKTWSATSLFIVSLDLEKESYRELLPPPDHRVITVVNFMLGVLRDCLCLFSNDPTFTDVWLMKEYGNNDSWTKLFRVPHMKDHPRSWSHACPLYVSEDDQVLLDMTSKLVVYNYRDGTFKDLRVQKTFSCWNSKVYHESLISPCP